MNYVKILGALRPVISFLARYGVKLLDFAIAYVKDLDGKDLDNAEKRRKAVIAIQIMAERLGKTISKEEAERLIKIAIVILRFIGK